VLLMVSNNTEHLASWPTGTRSAVRRRSWQPNSRKAG